MEFHQQLSNLDRKVSDPHRARETKDISMLEYMGTVRGEISRYPIIGDPNVLYYRGDICRPIKIGDLYVPIEQQSINGIPSQTKDDLIKRIWSDRSLVVTNKTGDRQLPNNVLREFKGEPGVDNIIPHILLRLACDHIKYADEVTLYPSGLIDLCRVFGISEDEEEHLLDTVFARSREFIMHFNRAIVDMCDPDDCVKLTICNEYLRIQRLGTIYQFKMFETNNRRYDEWDDGWSCWNLLR